MRTTVSWAGTRSCWRRSWRILPMWIHGSACSTSAAAPARSRACWWSASVRRRSRPSIRRRSSSPPRASAILGSTSGARPRRSCRSPTLAEMARVTRAGGVVSACVWDHAGEQTPLAPFWQAVHEVDPDAEDESGLAGGREGHLAELFAEAGLREVEDTALPVRVEHATFEEWWDPFTFGVGPAGSYVTALDSAQQVELRERCRQRLPRAPFTLSARAWAARGLV